VEVLLTRTLRTCSSALLLVLASISVGCTRLPELGNLSYLAPRERTRSVLSTIDPSTPHLTLSDLQLKGSHNSFHRAPRIALSRTWRYSHAPLDVQLSTQGARVLELDVRYARGELEVGHVPLFDGRTTCRRFVDCIARIEKWSSEHPAHLPVFVFVQVKDAVAPSGLDGKLDALDFAITRVFARHQLLVPEDVVADAPSLQAAVRTRGWPSVEQTRGRVAFVMFGERRHRRAYAKGRPRLDGRVMFVGESDVRQPHAGVMMVDNPLGNEAKIAHLVQQNFLVRTRADADLKRDRRRRDAALASGAHFIASDFISPTQNWLELDANAVGRCNPQTASTSCSPMALSEIERPALALSDFEEEPASTVRSHAEPGTSTSGSSASEQAPPPSPL
jgi:hypothetical protein